MNRHRIVCKFEGPLHGVVLREQRTRPGCYLTRQFNTRPDLGYSEGEYEGHYDMTFAGAFKDFVERVCSKVDTVIGDLRERDEKEARLKIVKA